MAIYYHAGGGLGPTARGVGILRALRQQHQAAEAVLISRWRYVARLEEMAWLPRGSWPAFQAGDVLVVDGVWPVNPAELAKCRARVVYVWKPQADEDRDQWYLPFVTASLAACEESELSAFAQEIGAVPTSRILPRELDEARESARAAAWWKQRDGPRYLAYHCGLRKWEARVVKAKAEQELGAPIHMVSPWLPGGFYWPAMELVPGAEAVVTGGGRQSRAECAALGVERHVAISFQRRGEDQRQHAAALASGAVRFDGAARAAATLHEIGGKA